MHTGWARKLRDQCNDAGVPFFLKQLGAYRSATYWDEPIREPDIWVAENDGRIASEEEAVADGGSWLGMHKMGVKRAGRLLDGEEWNQFPSR